jgi:multisubunit Na+/H+ antiporter MnhG subunit
MTSAVAVWLLLGVAVLVAVPCAVAATVVRDLLTRLHLLAPMTVVAGPLVAIAAGVSQGWTPTTTALVFLIIAVLAVTGPVLTTAIARAHLGDAADAVREEAR